MKIRYKKPKVIIIITLICLYIIFSYSQAFDLDQNKSNNFVEVKKEEEISITKEQVVGALNFIWSNLQKVIKTTISENNNTASISESQMHGSSQLNKKTIITDDYINNDSLDIIDGFDDISKSKYRQHINILKKLGIVKGYKGKFYPENDLRFYSLIKILIQSYRTKIGYPIMNSIGLSNKNHIGRTDNLSIELIRYINTAYELGLLDGINLINEENGFNQFVTYEILNKILINTHKQFPTISNNFIENTFIENQNPNRKIKQGEFVGHIVNFFDLQEQIEGNLFNNTYYHIHGKAIERLANLDIIDIKEKKYEIDEPISRCEFIKLLVKSVLIKKGENLNISIPNDIDNKIVDIEEGLCFNYVIYANNFNAIDYLFETIRGSRYFYPNKELTKHEAYYILQNSLNVNILYTQEDSDNKKISKGEVARLLYDILELHDNKYTVNNKIDKTIDVKPKNNYTNNTKITKNKDTITNIIKDFLQNTEILN